MSKYGHRLQNADTEKLFRVMLDKRKIRTKKEQEEFEAGYFALCLLLPKDDFLKIVDVFGGIDVVKDNDEIQSAIARLFNVEKILVKIRIKYLIEDMIKNQENGKKRIINLKNRIKK